MKERWWLAFGLFLSGYWPLGVILLVKNLDFSSAGSLPDVQYPWISALIASLTVVPPIALLLVLQQKSEEFEAQIEKLEDRSNEILNYSLPYVVAFGGVDFENPGGWLPFVVFMALMFLLTARTQSLFINPTLILFGYRYYNVEFKESGSETSRRKIFIAKGQPKSGQIVRIYPLNYFLYHAKVKEDSGWLTANRS